MFTAEPSLSWVQTTREQIVAVVESINQAQVSIPGKAAQAVSAHLCGLRNPNGSFSIYVALHLQKSGENVVYLPSRRQLTTADEYREIELEGLQFLESMGFMLDNLNFRNLAADVQEQVLRRVPLFSPPRAPAASAPSASPGAPGATSAAPDAARVARLLASF
ncbi:MULTISPECIES: hypothetical protein [Anaeromyxobacter]|uniref:hypothetical protein n=1 Tax=Anaeromyxobacter TaxID=161492 RepID=UPI001F57C6F5|nr:MULTISPECIES: hypothetical protein [unclassified Anaeromyxobacter]